MSAPRRWVDDPDADEALRELLRGTTGARPIDQLTRRRLGAKVARASALPAAAAGWLFVKSAAAALSVVLGGGALAASAGVVHWSPRLQTESRAEPAAPKPQRAPSPAARPAPEVAPIIAQPEPLVNPSPSLPAAPVASTSGTLSAEAALLEKARREMRARPELALSIAAEHAQRFVRGQLASERTLIQIEALHRLGRDSEARKLARGLPGLYAERVERLLGPNTGP